MIGAQCNSTSVNLKQLDDHITEMEITVKALNAELSAARAFRPFLAKRENEPETATAPVPVQAALIPSTANGDGYGAVMRNIRAAIEKCPENYTVYNIETQLSALGVSIPREAISQAMSRLAKKGEVVVHERGSGRAPSIYRKESATT